MSKQLHHTVCHKVIFLEAHIQYIHKVFMWHSDTEAYYWLIKIIAKFHIKRILQMSITYQYITWSNCVVFAWSSYSRSLSMSWILPVHGKQTQALFCAFKNAGHPKTAVLLYMTLVTDWHAVHSTLWQHPSTCFI